jgi:GntR family transcriptional repressor for pyruvate dehydrogenase complex
VSIKLKAGERADSEREAARADIRPARRRSLPQEIVEQLLELVASGSLPGNRLPAERDLSDRLRVSRTSTREALSALVQLGVIQTRGKAKYGDPIRASAQLLARPPSRDSERELLSDPIETRRILEPEAARIAAERASDEDLARIESWCEQMEAAALGGERVIEHDSAFHVQIARATGNELLTQLVSALTESLRESRELSYLPPRGIDISLRGHRRILAALRARDPVGARREMRRHLDDVERLIRLALRDAGS